MKWVYSMVHPRVDGAKEEGAEEMEVEETEAVSCRDSLPEVPSAGQVVEREDGEITDSSEPNHVPIDMATLQSALVEMDAGIVDDASVQAQGAAWERASAVASPTPPPAEEEGSGPPVSANSLT